MGSGNRTNPCRDGSAVFIRPVCVRSTWLSSLRVKCDARNEPSMRAARRFGFTYEGTFRQHMVVKGENRDTAWFAITDTDWPHIRQAFEQWLEPANFDHQGQQKMR